MKDIIKYGIFTLMSILALTSCDPQDNDDHKLGSEPTAEELNFSITPSGTANVFIIEDTSPRAGVAVWDLGNYSKGKGSSIEAQYPFKGEYTVTMTLYTTGGSQTISKTINITEDNFDLLDTPMYNTLTGGFENVNGRTWVFDRNNDGHFGVGPATDSNPSWWSCPANGKADCSLYDQEFTFSMSKETGLKLVWTNKDKVYTNEAGKNDLAKKGYPNASEPPAGDWDVEYTPAESYGFVMSEAAMSLEILNDGFVGHYTGSSSYSILSELGPKNEVLYLKTVSAVESGNGWWYRFVPKQ